MAELYGAWQIAVDANNNPLPGALLGTFDSVATTTPKTTYSDPDLTTPHTNPVVADAGGKFPQVFADTGESFYLTLKTSAGVLIADYERVDALGETGTGAFERDFDAGGRYKLSGALGVVSQDFGPPEGDDIGGSARMGGWNGTQGEDLEIDYETTTIKGDLVVEGDVVGGGAANFPRLLDSGNESAVAQADIELDPAFDRYQLEIYNLNTSGTGGLRLRFSFDDGATYKDGASDYLGQGYYQDNSAFVNVPVATAAFITLTSSTDTDVDTGRVFLDIRSQAGHESHAESRFTVFDSSTTSSESGVRTGTTNAKAFGKATHVRIYPGSGTATFGYKLMGHP